MKQLTKQLRTTAVESLVLGINHFNQMGVPARVQGVLLPLQHSMEMLAKAAIYEKRGRIRDRGSRISFSFGRCLAILKSDLGLIDAQEAMVAERVDGHRDAVQHYGSRLVDQVLFVDAMSTVSWIDDLLLRGLGERLADQPGFVGRPLPVTSEPPRSLLVIYEHDFREIGKLLAPGTRMSHEAYARLRPHVVADQAVDSPGNIQQPTETDLKRIGARLREGEPWAKVFPGLSRLALLAADDATHMFKLVRRDVDGQAAPVRMVGEDNPDAADAAILQQVDFFSRYPFGERDLIEHTGLGQGEVRALVHLLGLKNDERFFKHRVVRKIDLKLYTHAALSELRAARDAGRVSEAKAALRGFNAGQRAR